MGAVYEHSYIYAAGVNGSWAQLNGARRRDPLSSIAMSEQEETTHSYNSPIDYYEKFFDDRNNKTRERLVFMEETKIWQELLNKCSLRAGPDALSECRQLFDLVQERIKYYNSKYRHEMRPSLSPGLPPQFEK
jgi:hypothetical protein